MSLLNFVIAACSSITTRILLLLVEKYCLIIAILLYMYVHPIAETRCTGLSHEDRSLHLIPLELRPPIGGILIEGLGEK